MNAGWWILAALAVVAVLVWLARWAVGEPIDCDRIIADTPAPEPLTGTAVPDGWVYDGPAQTRLLEHTERYINQLAADDPELAAGFDRLWDAVRDHREEEEL